MSGAAIDVENVCARSCSCPSARRLGLGQSHDKGRDRQEGPLKSLTITRWSLRITKPTHLLQSIPALLPPANRIPWLDDPTI